MRINDDHLFHGAALTQVAEHPSFKAINAFVVNGATSRCAFLVNLDIGLYLKYATKPKAPFGEFVFTFLQEHLDELKLLQDQKEKVFVGLICVAARQICCVSLQALRALISERQRRKGTVEGAYTVLVTVPRGKRCRVYMNVPGRRKAKLGEQIIPRDSFPDVIFQP